MSSDLFKSLIHLALQEDLAPKGDLTTNAIFTKPQSARLHICARAQTGIVSGSQFIKTIYQAIDPEISVQFLKPDGTKFEAEAKLATIQGNIQAILQGERLALNLLQRAVSIASLTHQFVSLIQDTSAQILDTRKTTPGLRLLEKAAVKDGGGLNHRFNLSDGILIKDNHIALAGGIKAALQLAKAHKPYLSKIEIEVDSLAQLKEVIEEKIADIVLLDNFTLDELKQAVIIAKGHCQTEASGGINLQTVQEIAKTGIDFISIGALTQSPPLIDLGLDY